MTRALPLVGLCCLLLASCKKDGEVPAYIQVDTPEVVADDGQGTSSKITDLWIFVNDQPAGVWQPGRRIPLIAKGNSTVKLIAGVRRNGITDDRIQYPFYATWQQQVQLVPEQTVVLAPVVHYFSNLNYWLADFNTGLRFDTLLCSATMQLVPSDSTLVGQGTQHGRIVLDSGHSIYRGVSSGDAFTNTGSSAFLELDYRSDTRLLVGVRYTASGSQYEVAYVYALPTKQPDGSMPWNKLYVDLAEPWNVPGALDKRFFIKAELENGATTGIVEVDNIKLVRP
ncbi:MAG: hypothetical protein KBH07_11075 [Flavobacteriales bacterium]|nr:hypothetical protein [Flavobacteriales bacterium]MBP9080538.1 hypothetical protein [Flavobacteriales bacterium]